MFHQFQDTFTSVWTSWKMCLCPHSLHHLHHPLLSAGLSSSHVFQSCHLVPWVGFLSLWILLPTNWVKGNTETNYTDILINPSKAFVPPANKFSPFLCPVPFNGVGFCLHVLVIARPYHWERNTGLIQYKKVLLNHSTQCKARQITPVSDLIKEEYQTH